MASINYTVADDWQSGFIGKLIVPGGDHGLQGWTLEFDASFTITNIWGAEIVSHIGTHYVVRSAGWTADVPPGGQTSFGFEATSAIGDTTAHGFVLNGMADAAQALPALSIADASIAEGDTGAQLVFTVTLSRASSSPVTVHYATTDGSASSDSDYGALSGTLTFAAGETSKAIAVPVVGDTAIEADERFALTLSGASGATIARASAAGTIVNDDHSSPSSGARLDYAVTSDWESGFTGSMTVTAGSGGFHGWTVEFDSSATITNIWNAEIVSHVGDHYVVRNASWNVDVAAGKSVSFGFQATPGRGGTAVSGFTVNGAEVGDPRPVLPTLSVADASVSEGNGGIHDIAFTVTLSAASSTPVTVSYTTVNGTATAGADYTAASGTLTFAAGETSKIVNVRVSGDTDAESDEALTLHLSAPNGATIADGTATGMIVNDDTTLPALSIGNARFTEGGTASPGHGSFTVVLSAASSTPVSVNYATIDRTAVAGSDYVSRSGTLTFAAGETQKTIRVDAIGDGVAEANESFVLRLSGASGATIADAMGVGTIVNDDSVPPPTLSIADTSVVEGNPGTGSSAAPGWFSTSGNQIVDSAGHSVQIAGVNWFGFESSTLAPHGLWTRGYKEMMDQMVELGFNTIRLPFSSETLHSTAAPNGIDFSKNPDLQGLSALQIMDKIIDYAGEVGLRIILDHHRSDSGPGTSPNGLWYDDQHSDAQWVADWQMLASRYANDPTVIGADLHNEPYNGTWGGGGPNDWAAAAERAGNAIGQVNPNWLIFVEGIGTYQGESYWWGGNLMGVKDRPIELDVDNKLVYSAHDYPHSVYAQPWFEGDHFGAGLPAKFDQMWGYIYKEGIAPVYIGEFGTSLTDPKDTPWLEAITGYLGGDFNNDGVKDIAAGEQGISWTFWSWNPNSGDTGGILADDWRTVNQAKLDYLEPIKFDMESSAPGTHADFVISLSAPATQAVSVAWATIPGEAGSADFEASSGTITFAAGDQSKTISIPVTSDLLVEGNERFSVVLSGAVGATIERGTATGTIIDDDASAPLPTLSVSDAIMSEGDSGARSLAFTVSLSAAATSAVTVAYATASGTATAGSDFTAKSGTLTFAPGETSKVVQVAVSGDTAIEGNETLGLTLSAADGATIADGTATGTITNDDTTPSDSDLHTRLTIADSWNSGFNASVTVHNDGTATHGWQIAIDMPYQIGSIWNAEIVSHEGTRYVIGNADWNGELGRDAETNFGFTASGGLDVSAIHIQGIERPQPLEDDWGHFASADSSGITQSPFGSSSIFQQVDQIV